MPVINYAYFLLPVLLFAEPSNVAPLPDIPEERIVNLGEVESLILTRTNEIRQKHGLNQLRSETTLRNIARAHSDDMIRRDFFDHVNPDGQRAADRIALGHRRLIGGVGENIWRYTAILEIDGRQKPEYIHMPPRKMAEQAVQSWMNSPGHRENMLYPEFTHLGVGVSIVKGQVVATQNFGTVRAFTSKKLPSSVRKGGHLKLETTSILPSDAEAVRYDYWIEEKEKVASEPIPIANGKVMVDKGVYRIRFFFPVSNGYSIYWGPRIVVK